MCMQDYLMGKKTGYAQSIVSVSAVAFSELIEANPLRKWILFGNPFTGTMALQYGKEAPTTLEGIPLMPDGFRILLTMEQHGNIVKERFWGRSTAGTLSLTIWQGFFDEEEMK